MKYIKTFENLNKTPEIGDYVIMKRDDAFMNFLENNIGQIIELYRLPSVYKLNNKYRGEKIFKVKYDTEVPFNFNSKIDTDIEKYTSKGINVRNFIKSEIEHLSKDKDNLEDILAAKNFNL